MSVGDRIRQRRKELGLTQEDLACKIGTIKQTIYKYEHSIITNIPSKRLDEIAIALETTTPYLKSLIDDPSPDIDFNALIIDTEKIAARAEQLRAQEKAKKTIEDGSRIACVISVNVGIPDMYLKDSVEDADTDLLLTVHEICGMDNETITEDTVSGAIYQKWDPKKIKLVKDYLLDGQSQIKKIINAELANEQTPREKIRAAGGTPDSSK